MKKLFIFALSMIMIATLALGIITANASVSVDEANISVADGWVKKQNDWYYYINGKKIKNSWQKDSVGWCYLGADGKMVTNQWIMDSVSWCYVGNDGYCVTNEWRKDSVGWCYLDSEGRMAVNQWVMDSVGWCYVGNDGYCVTNEWRKDSVGWCYLDSEGRMAVNRWVMDSTGWCYVGNEGYCLTGKQVIDGTEYTFSSEGVLIEHSADYELEVVRLINEIRKENGLNELTVNEDLAYVARVKSQDMHDKKYFDHQSPTYGSPFEMMDSFGIQYRTAGENIAMGYTTPAAVVEGWMNSPGHRANILTDGFTQIGMGYVADGHYWTQMFIG